MPLLSGLRVVQLGGGEAAAVCGRLLADAGAEIVAIDAGGGTPLSYYLDHGKAILAAAAPAAVAALASAELIVCEGRPGELRARGWDAAALRRLNPNAALVYVSPFGQTGPRADDPASDLTLFFASGIARLLAGQVDDIAEPPLRPAGEQSAFIGGSAAACAGMHAALTKGMGAVIDVSIEEALATMALTELARAGLAGRTASRRRVADGNGATVTVLPACDGYAAISPRDERQWAAWLGVIGQPEWGADPRFRTKPDRVANWDALYALLCEWSRQNGKQEIADRAQQAHVPSFPLREPAEQFASPQLAHRDFWRPLDLDGRHIQVPGLPFKLQESAFPTPCLPSPASGGGSGWGHSGQARGADALPLAGVRVLDFSWVIAGPTATRYLAAMGAEIIKVEAPGAGDPGRASELHTVLGQGKRGIVLDLKKHEAVAVARALAGRCDILIENFATGVMERLGLGAEELRAQNPQLIYLSASGLGRSGPEAHTVAYGTLLQCYAGFAGLNRHPERPPRVGMAWLDPMCGLMLAFAAAAALLHRRWTGAGGRIDFSMIEAMLWTMAEPLLLAQLEGPPQPQGNHSRRHVPHGVYRAAGDDAWVAVAATSEEEWHRLCAAAPPLAPFAALDLDARRRHEAEIDAALAAWLAPLPAAAAAADLRRAGVPAAALADALDLVADPHLQARGFWQRHGVGVLPGLPWHASFGRADGPAPGLGEHTEAVLSEMLGLSPAEIGALRQAGALG
jgi:crotonobetainyl-CoA:carnitine CoA-transferase CaiB-like acyl-CoA transferase